MKAKKGVRGLYQSVVLVFHPQTCQIWHQYTGKIEKMGSLSFTKAIHNASDIERQKYMEDLVNLLRPELRQGHRSIIFISPASLQIADLFQVHIARHHRWINAPDHPFSGIFRFIDAEPQSSDDIFQLIMATEFQTAIQAVTIAETDRILTVLEERLHQHEESMVFVGLEENERLVYAGGTKAKKFRPLKLIPEYVLLTESFYNHPTSRNRVHRLLQIAQNRGLSVRIIPDDAPLGTRLTTIGGMASFVQIKSEFERKLGDQFLHPNRSLASK